MIIKKTGSEEVAESDLTTELFNEAMAKSTAEKSLTKVNSVGKLPTQTGLIPKRKHLTHSSKFTYAIIQGNNSNLLKRIMQMSNRDQYWEDNTHLYQRQPAPAAITNVTGSGFKDNKTLKKFIAGNVIAN